ACPDNVWSGLWPRADRWRGQARAASQARSSSIPLRLSSRSQGAPSAFRLVVGWDCVEFEPMIAQPRTEAPRDVGLRAFDVFRLKLDQLARAQIDEMVVMAVGHLFVARAPVAELVALDDAGILE